MHAHVCVGAWVPHLPPTPVPLCCGAHPRLHIGLPGHLHHPRASWSPEGPLRAEDTSPPPTLMAPMMVGAPVAGRPVEEALMNEM